MEKPVFEINDRFLVDRNKNRVWDKEKGLGTRLEPRLMKLLCLLVERRGELVTREYAAKEIWNEYPGANEGLNQAISFLRKQLADDSKEIIKTIPKVGYSFHGIISLVSENVADKKFEYKWTRLIAVGFLSFFLLLFILYYSGRKNAYIPSEDLNIKRNAELSRLDSIHQAETMKPYNKK